MNARIAEHAVHSALKYYLALLTQEGYENVVVTPVPGRLLPEIVSLNRFQADPTSVYSRFPKIKSQLNNHVKKSGSLENSEFSLGRVFYPRQLVDGKNPDYYKDFGLNKLYAVNRHRLIGYGMWIAEYGFQPARIYFCEQPSPK